MSSAINETVLWAAVASRIGFYSKETAHQIPAIPGVYGWFLPLWMYDSAPERFIAVIQSIYRTEGRDGGGLQARVEDRWESIDIRLNRLPKGDISEQFRETWKGVQDDTESRATFERALMEASILMPPLYVGKADDLSVRYEDHVTGRNPHSNTFYKRFVRVTGEIGLTIEVSDLLFVCIRADAPESANTDVARKINWLVEQTLMRLACPPFSLR